MKKYLGFLSNQSSLSGAGSKTPDLFPEIATVCAQCVGLFTEHSDIDPLQLAENINVRVFQLQISHNFLNPSLWHLKKRLELGIDLNPTEEDANSESDIDCEDDPGFHNPFIFTDEPLSADGGSMKDSLEPEDIIIEESDYFVNPFLEEPHTSDQQQFCCGSCKIDFGEESYLTFHNEVFHSSDDLVPGESSHVTKASLGLRLNYVEDGELLIQSFSIEEKEQQKKGSTEEENKPVRRSKKVSKYPA